MKRISNPIIRKRLQVALVAGMVWGLMNVTLLAQGIFAVGSWLAPLHQSNAFRQFLARPYSELSKIIFLIDRFAETEVQILYDGHYYSSRFVKQIARWFLFHHYRKETAQEWILKWCHKTIGNNVIWVKIPDGTLRLSREVLAEELGALEKAYLEQQRGALDLKVEIPPGSIQRNPAPGEAGAGPVDIKPAKEEGAPAQVYIEPLSNESKTNPPSVKPANEKIGLDQADTKPLQAEVISKPVRIEPINEETKTDAGIKLTAPQKLAISD